MFLLPVSPSSKAVLDEAGSKDETERNAENKTDNRDNDKSRRQLGRSSEIESIGIGRTSGIGGVGSQNGVGGVECGRHVEFGLLPTCCGRGSGT